MGNAWVIDARHYDTGADITDSTLFQSRKIKDFLTTPQATTAVICAPKGCGKTLLIKHKRKRMEVQDYTLIPSGQMADYNPGNASDFNNDDIYEIEDQPEFWSQIWQISICISVLKALGKAEDLQELNKIDPKICGGSWSGPFEVFEHLLRTRVRDFSKLYEAYRKSARPIYSTDHGTRVAVFIDNIDEFFSLHLHKTVRVVETGSDPSDKSSAIRDRVYGQLSRKFWDSAQIGFLFAVQALKAQNAHIKIYGTIRSEALNSYKAWLPDLANARALLVELDYGYEDLKEIFEKNIQADRKTFRIADSKSPDRFAQFFGPNNVHLRHINTGLTEHVFDYCLRHTLWRPRDLIRIGDAISNLKLDARTPDTIRQKANGTAAEICADYLGEVRSQFDWFTEDLLFTKIFSCVLDRDDLIKIATEYHEAAEEHQDRNNPLAIFADLYNAGLLGIVVQNAEISGRWGWSQRFAAVNDIGASHLVEQRRLPEASTYLIHPVFGSFLRKYYPNGLKTTHSVNIISPKGSWYESGDFHFILKADVAKSSQIYSDKVSEDTFKDYFENAILSDLDRDIDFVEPDGGDGMLLIDRSLYLLLRKARYAQERLMERFEARFRFGLEYGRVHYAQNASGQRSARAYDLITRAERLRQAAHEGQLLTLSHTAREFEKFQFTWAVQALHDPNECRAKRVDGQWELGKDHESIRVAKIFGLNITDICE